MSRIIIGVPICESKTYIWPLLRQNLYDLHAAYPGYCRVVFAVEMDDLTLNFWEKLTDCGEVEIYKADNYLNGGQWLHNIVSSRNALRDYFLNSNADYLYMADCDMVIEKDALRKMHAQISGYDMVNSAYRIRQTGAWGFGSSPALYTRDLMQRVHWRCKWWAEKRFLAEDELLDFDLFLLGAKVNRGAFITNTHYASAELGHTLTAGMEIPLFRQLANSLPVRFILVGLSRLIHYDIGLALHKIINKKGK